GYTGTTAAGSGSAYGLFANRLGSILTAVSISTGAVAADYDYDAFGTQTQTVNTIEQRYGYTGREQDYETGLIYYRARHYDPATGQFIQRDPIGFAAGDLNLYAYTWNDPYNWTDPSGLATNTLSHSKLSQRVAAGARSVVGTISGGVTGLAANIRNALLAMAIVGVANSVSDDGSEAAPQPKKGGGKNAQHGSQSEADKIGKQIKELEERLKELQGSQEPGSKKERRDLAKKIKNLKQKQARAKKGENHSQKPKGNR
ncbi:RHS repeat-associated core domain-containing protein, partial [Ruegeria halocynthiae]|uniref:RHS repeat-associated core domain-containing protein n=1 Tax=Ruegeria halocynthiae TaxID=985054 RepID=UPI00055CF381